MRILSWNIWFGGGRRLAGILRALEEAAADTIVLSEFRNNMNGMTIRSHLHELGYTNQHRSSESGNAYAVLIASKTPLDKLSFADHLGEDGARCAAARIGGVNLFGFYFAQKAKMMPLFQFLFDLPEEFRLSPSLLIGDYNTGKNYLDEKAKALWGSEYIEKLEHAGWVDGWRHFPRTKTEYSWYSKHGNGFRIDHAFLSGPALRCLKSVEYWHEPREKRLSDHSALICELEA